FLEAVQGAGDQRAVRPGAGPGDVEVVAPRLGGVVGVAHAAVEARGVPLETALGVRAVPLGRPLAVHHPPHLASCPTPPLADRSRPLTLRVCLGVPCAQFAVGYPTRPSWRAR